MKASAKDWWNKPLKSSSIRAFTFIVFGAGIALQGWLGRERLVAHDRQYQLAFLVFAGIELILAGLIQKLAKRAREHKQTSDFNTTQLQLGIISFLVLALFWIFGDYTTSSLNAGSVVVSLSVAAIIVSLNMSMSKPAEVDEE